MRKALIVASREYLASVRTKAFLVSIGLVPVIMVASIVLIKDDAAPARTGPRTVVILDHTGTMEAALGPAFTASGFQIEDFEPSTPMEPDSGLARRLRAGEVAAVVDVAASSVDVEADLDPVDPSAIIYAVNPIGYTTQWILGQVREALQLQRLLASGLDEDSAQRLLGQMHVDVRPPPAPDVDSSDPARVAEFVAPFVAVMLVFLAVMGTATPMLQSVIEEKQQRIAEVLLGSLSPFYLMVGKLLGTAAAGLTMVGAYVCAGLGVAYYQGYGGLVSASMIAFVLLDTVVAVALFGSVFVALGAAANELKDAQGMMTPVLLIIVAPLITLGTLIRDPEGALALTLSFFPLSAPMVMPLRIGMSALVPTWQIALSAALTLAAAVGMIWAAGRVFRVGILLQGEAPGFREILRWVLHG